MARGLSLVAHGAPRWRLGRAHQRNQRGCVSTTGWLTNNRIVPRRSAVDASRFDNATIGDGTIVEPNVQVGFAYHPQCGPARIGKHGILRVGTIIYGDVTIGDYFQTGHYAVIRAKVAIGDYCTLCNHSTLEGIIRMGH